MSRSPSPLFTPPPSPLPDCDVASLDGPSIPGLFYYPALFTSEEADAVVEDIVEQGYFDVANGRDQAVLFGSRDTDTSETSLPAWVPAFLSLAATRLAREETLPKDVFRLLFPHPSEAAFRTKRTRQLILNCYQPGQGIGSHIDLPHQFLDGIMIFSFGSGITMTFEGGSTDSEPQSVYLLPRSVCVLSGESRWAWSHGIPARESDTVWDAGMGEQRVCKRGQRLSITVRWYKLKHGGDEDVAGPWLRSADE